MKSSPDPDPVTECLARMRGGMEDDAAETLLSLVYDELRSLARSHLGRRRNQETLQATALVHEAYLRLVKHDAVGWESRAHFFAVAAKAIRQVLSNHVRGKRTKKRSADGVRVTLAVAEDAGSTTAIDVLSLNEALAELAEFDERQAQVVELRFFAGMSFAEIAHVQQVSERTAERDWRMARAWLSKRLRELDE